MLDLLAINPAGYAGNPRRGPYELTTLVSQLNVARYKASLLDIQEEIGNGSIAYPSSHLDAAIDRIAETLAHVYLINIRTTAGPWAHEIAKSLKRRFPDRLIIAYAPRIEERITRLMAEDDAFDGLFLSDPCFSITSVISAVKSKQSLISVPGIVPRQGRLPVRASSSPLIAKSPGDDYEIGSPWVSPDQTISAIAVGRGCPDRCTFCAAPLGVGGLPRYASASAIAASAQAAFDMLDRSRRLFVMLEVENLTSNQRLIEEIGQQRSSQNLTFLWGAYARIDHMTPDMQRLLFDSGCRFLFFGIETASPRLLKLLGKHYDPGMVLTRLKALHHAGITTHSSLIFGIPTETYEDFLATATLSAHIAWAGGYIDLSPLRIEAGTAMERLTDGHPLRLLRNSELFRELTTGGVPPESCNPLIGYRMYGLDLQAFDIDIIYLAARRFRSTLVHFPLTVYVLVHGCNIAIESIIHAAKSAVVLQTDSDWIYLILANLMSPAKEFACEMYRTEQAISNSLPIGAETQQCYLIAPLYQTLRINPKLIPSVFGLDWWSSDASFQPTAVDL